MLQILQENNSVCRPVTLLKRDYNAVFSCEIYKIFKNTFSSRTPTVTASDF